jgi:hypothetical protein
LQTKSALLEGSPVLKGARLCKDTSCQVNFSYYVIIRLYRSTF